MLSIGNKTFMNLQEAVGWLLENNNLMFLSSANYVANVEISNSTLINPSPAKIKIGSLVLFGNSKVSTVTGISSSGFMVGDQFTDLSADGIYVASATVNSSAHLIITLSNETEIDAGLIKEVSSFSINSSQHLIANYNDGTSTDLGAIFNGNINISGNLDVSGNITGNLRMSDIKDSAGNKRFLEDNLTLSEISGVEFSYGKWSLSGTHLMFVLVGKVNANQTLPNGILAGYGLPQFITDKIVNVWTADNSVDIKEVKMRNTTGQNPVSLDIRLLKVGNTMYIYNTSSETPTEDKYFRIVFDVLIDSSY